MANSGDSLHEFDVLIIGAGFGGCYLLHLLRKNGYKTKVVDAAITLGGVWAWNRYPGARVDCEFPTMASQIPPSGALSPGQSGSPATLSFDAISNMPRTSGT